MNLFRMLAMLSPLILGLTVPFLISWVRQRDQDGRSAAVTLIVFFVTCMSVLLLMAIIHAEPVVRWVHLSIYLLSFSVLLVSMMYFWMTLRVGPTMAQILTSLAAVLMMGTVFYFKPLIEASDHKTAWCSAAVVLNPWVIVGGSILEMDVLHQPFIYGYSKILEYVVVAYPRWLEVAMNYAIVSAVLWFPWTALRIWRWTGGVVKPVQQTDSVPGNR